MARIKVDKFETKPKSTPIIQEEIKKPKKAPKPKTRKAHTPSTDNYVKHPRISLEQSKQKSTVSKPKKTSAVKQKKPSVKQAKKILTDEEKKQRNIARGKKAWETRRSRMTDEQYEEFRYSLRDRQERKKQLEDIPTLARIITSNYISELAQLTAYTNSRPWAVELLETVKSIRDFDMIGLAKAVLKMEEDGKVLTGEIVYTSELCVHYMADLLSYLNQLNVLDEDTIEMIADGIEVDENWELSSEDVASIINNNGN